MVASAGADVFMGQVGGIVVGRGGHGSSCDDDEGLGGSVGGGGGLHGSLGRESCAFGGGPRGGVRGLWLPDEGTMLVGRDLG